MTYNSNNFLHQLLMSDINVDDNDDMIPIITLDPDENMSTDDLPDELPILAVRNTVLFPGVVLPITVSRKKSVRLVRKAHKGDKTIGVVAQKNMTSDEPAPEDLFEVGTVAKILKMLVLPDGNTTIIIQGQSRFKVEEITQEDPFLQARISYCTETFPNKKSKEIKALVQSLKDAAAKMLKLSPEIPQEALPVVEPERGGGPEAAVAGGERWRRPWHPAAGADAARNSIAGAKAGDPYQSTHRHRPAAARLFSASADQGAAGRAGAGGPRPGDCQVPGTCRQKEMARAGSQAL
jgi:Lon protease-like protein